MQLGFAMLESGTVREHNVIATFAKNLLDVLISIMVGLFFGYNLAFPGEEVHVLALNNSEEHHGMRQSDYMEDLVTQTGENLGKPYKFTENQLFRMLREALGQGEHEEVRELHETRHPSMQLQSIDDLLEPYKHQQASGTRAYDVYADMPAIQHYQLPPSLQPGNKEEFHQKKEEITKHLRDRN